MSDYCVCADCGCRHLVWEKSCPYCRKIAEQATEIAMLKKELKGAVTTKYHDYIVAEAMKIVAAQSKEIHRLREAVQAAFDCGMVPNSTAKDGGAASYGESVRVADMLREALEVDDE